MNDYVQVDHQICGGKPVIRGTRIPVELILRKIAAKVPTAEICRDYPRLTEDDISAALNYAADAVSTDEIMEFAEAAK